MVSSVTPCIWMDGTAEEAARFYVALFPNSRIETISRYPDESPFPPNFPPGTAMLVTFTLDGRPFATLNGGPIFPQTEAVSFVIPVEDQAELDHYWQALTADGGMESMCGWCKDRFGVSWQVVPRRLLDMQSSSDAAAVLRMSSAIMTMRKLDIAALEAAFSGD